MPRWCARGHPGRIERFTSPHLLVRRRVGACSWAETASARPIDGLLDAARESRSGDARRCAARRGSARPRCWSARWRAPDGMRVLTGAGVEAESELPFAGLHQLLWPILDHADALPDVQSRCPAGRLRAVRRPRRGPLPRLRRRAGAAHRRRRRAAAAVRRRRCALARWRVGRRARVRRPAPAGRSDRRAHRRPRGRRALLRGARAARAAGRRAARRRRRRRCSTAPCPRSCATSSSASPAATRSPCSSCPPRSPTTSARAARRCASTCR